MESSDQLVNKVQNAYENWNNNVYKKSLVRFPERQKEFNTQSFTPVNLFILHLIFKTKNTLIKSAIRCLSIYTWNSTVNVPWKIMDNETICRFR